MYDVSWEEYIANIEELAGRLKNEEVDADSILAINRGGLLIGLIFSHQLNLPLHIFHLGKPFDLHRHKKIILVDDISDTGKTFIKTLMQLEQENELDAEKGIYTVALHIKPETQFKPDLYHKVVTEWVKYPYEVDIYKRESDK